MFSDLPPEVISNHIFPFLHVNDLLRLRRVSKVSKGLTEDYLRLYGTSEGVVHINRRRRDLTRFLALTYPINMTRFCFNNRDDSSWEGEEMQTLLHLYGEKITHLTINYLEIPIKSPSTVQFFEGLSNLKTLRIEALHETPSRTDQVPPQLNLPSTFKQLKNLNVEHYRCRPQLLHNFLNECSTNLERVNYPRLHDSPHFYAPDDVFEWVRRIVDTRHQQDPDRPNLKYFELDRFEEDFDETYVRSFFELVTICSAHGVKLQNVDAKLIEEMMQLDTPDRGLHGAKISRCVVSIKNLTKSLFHLELPVLEKIFIWSTSVCSMPEGEFERQTWSNLKQLKLSVDSEYLDNYGGSVNVSRLLEFLFHGIRRENMESLELLFESWRNKEMLPYPNMTDVCVSCPNLKKLHISKWPGGNRDIAKMWGNLPLLEDVTFESCKTVGDAAFIGDDVTEPVILQATRLKSLKLRGLECMPGITDSLFQPALGRMSLKALYLISRRPVSSITLGGLETLLTGKFAETIDKFPLKGTILLQGVTQEQLTELQRKFRSSQM